VPRPLPFFFLSRFPLFPQVKRTFVVRCRAFELVVDFLRRVNIVSPRRICRKIHGAAFFLPVFRQPSLYRAQDLAKSFFCLPSAMSLPLTYRWLLAVRHAAHLRCHDRTGGLPMNSLFCRLHPPPSFSRLCAVFLSVPFPAERRLTSRSRPPLLFLDGDGLYCLPPSFAVGRRTGSRKVEIAFLLPFFDASLFCPYPPPDVTVRCFGGGRFPRREIQRLRFRFRTTPFSLGRFFSLRITILPGQQHDYPGLKNG